MKSSIVKTALIAITLLLAASVSFAVENKPESAGATNAKASAKSVKPKEDTAASKIKLVDINSATKDELKKLPGISDAEADKIIAGRPYLTKAHLVTHNIISESTYQSLSKLIIAKQKNMVKPKK